MPATFTLRGRVKDATTGTPVPDALVKIVGGTLNFGKSAITNSSGRYKITGVKPEKLIIEAALSYKPKDQILTVNANKTVNFALSKI